MGATLRERGQILASGMIKSHRRLDTPENVKIDQAEHQICSAIGQMCEKHYPGYRWQITCVAETGIATIKNLEIHGDYGVVLHLKDILNDPALKSVVNGCGELLERCNLPRSGRPDHGVEGKRDLRGNLILDTHGA